MTPEQIKVLKEALCAVLAWTVGQLHEGRRGIKHPDDKATITDHIEKIEAILERVREVF